MASNGPDHGSLSQGRPASRGRRPPAKNDGNSTRGASAGEEPLDAALLLNALTGLRRGELSARLPVDRTGTTGKIYDAFNEVADVSQQLARELVRIGHAVGKEGRTGERV